MVQQPGPPCQGSSHCHELSAIHPRSIIHINVGRGSPKIIQQQLLTEKRIYWLFSGCRLTAAANAKTEKKGKGWRRQNNRQGFFFNLCYPERLNAILERIVEIKKCYMCSLFSLAPLRCLAAAGWLALCWCGALTCGRQTRVKPHELWALSGAAGDFH